MLNTVIIVEDIIENDVVSGTVDGLNVNFNTAFDYVPGTLKLYLNGLRQIGGSGNDYEEGGTNMILMGIAPLPGDVLIADYKKK